MIVRTFTDADLDTARALWAATEHLGPVDSADLDRARAVAPELVVVAEIEGEVAGVVLGGDDGRRGWISRLAVATGHRRRGVARALVSQLETRLAARGCVQVNLLVFAGNDGGRATWEQLGYDGHEKVVLYTRRLEPDLERHPGGR
jgi:ribosomal protein S18 acetylase RimI-like enzyme